MAICALVLEQPQSIAPATPAARAAFCTFGANGEITMTTATAVAGLPTAVLGKTLILTPNVQNAALAPGVAGAVDWGCSSTSAQIAADRGIVVVTLGTLPAKYAPAECR